MPLPTDECVQRKPRSTMDLQNFLWQFEQDNRSSYCVETRWLAARAKEWHDTVQSAHWPATTRPVGISVDIAQFRQAEIDAEIAEHEKKIDKLKKEAAKLPVIG